MPAERVALAGPPLVAVVCVTQVFVQVGAYYWPALMHASECLVGLTEREREVLSRMAAGDSNKLIPRRFDLSPHTVKRHVANILDRLGVDTRGQAATRWRNSMGS